LAGAVADAIRNSAEQYRGRKATLQSKDAMLRLDRDVGFIAAFLLS